MNPYLDKAILQQNPISPWIAGSSPAMTMERGDSIPLNNALVQTPVVPRLEGGVVGLAVAWLSRSAGWLRRRRDRAIAIRELMKLDDRLLEDAGLARHELRALVGSRLG
jgi:uncharacterized protein YjiS (DUF1127 family)